MVGELAGGRSEQQPGESSVPPGSHDEQVRVFGGTQQGSGGGSPNEHSRDVHVLSGDGFQCVGLDAFSGVKGVVTAAVFYR